MAVYKCLECGKEFEKAFGPTFGTKCPHCGSKSWTPLAAKAFPWSKKG